MSSKIRKPQPKFGLFKQQTDAVLEVDMEADLGLQNFRLKQQVDHLNAQIDNLNHTVDELLKGMPNLTPDLRVKIEDWVVSKHGPGAQLDASQQGYVTRLREMVNILPIQRTADHMGGYRIPKTLRGHANRVPDAHFALGF